MSIPKNKGGRIANHSAFYFILRAQRPADWRIVEAKFSHIGTSALLAIHEHLCAAKHFLLRCDAKFYVIIEKDHGIDKKKLTEIIEFALSNTNLFDRCLFEKGFLFSVDFVKNFHDATYFKSRKYKAQDILNAVNQLRGDIEPLKMEDELEQIMSKSVNNSDDGDVDTDEGLPF